MKRLIFLLVFLPALLFAQAGVTRQLFKATTNDTIASITVADSVYMRITSNGPWKQLTQVVNDTAYVTVYNKTTESDVIFMLSSEDFWTYANSVQFKIQATGTDTITSDWIGTSGLRGACTLVIRPDTSGTNTDYGLSYLMGD